MKSKAISWDSDDLPAVRMASTLKEVLDQGMPMLLRQRRDAVMQRVLNRDGALKLWNRLKSKRLDIRRATAGFAKGELPAPGKVFLEASPKHYDHRQLLKSDVNDSFLQPIEESFGVEFKHLSVLCTWNGWTTLEHVEEECGAGFGTLVFGAPKTWLFWKPGPYPARRRPDMQMTTKSGDTFVIPRCASTS